MFCCDLFLGISEIWNREVANLTLKISRVFARTFDLADPLPTSTQAFFGGASKQERRKFYDPRRLHPVAPCHQIQGIAGGGTDPDIKLRLRI